ncbi:MAG: hypothetical protein HY466_07055 [Deltaproteobacteria bacterium]|nr:hypothetical protein [Deltaproteobacteria bacterium]
MNFEKFKKLSDEEKTDYLCHSLGDKALFKNIQKSFLSEFSFKKVVNVVVDRYGIGEVPSVVVTLRKGGGKVILPKSYMGLPIIKIRKRKGVKLDF